MVSNCCEMQDYSQPPIRRRYELMTSLTVTRKKMVWYGRKFPQETLSSFSLSISIIKY